MTADKSSSGREGGRSLKTRVKTARKRSLSSALWLSRQLNDPYVARAKAEGYRSRAAFKLLEIDDRYRLLKPGGRIIDLGAAPGGWSQVAAQRVGAAEGQGRIVAVDLLEMEPVPGVEFSVMDFNDEDAPSRIKAMMGGQVDGVLSDMAANSTGHKKTDHLRIMGLVELALEFSREVLAPARLLPGQGAAGRNRGRAAGDPQARLHDGSACQAERQPGRFVRTLRSGDRVPRR